MIKDSTVAILCSSKAIIYFNQIPFLTEKNYNLLDLHLNGKVITTFQFFKPFFRESYFKQINLNFTSFSLSYFCHNFKSGCILFFFLNFLYVFYYYLWFQRNYVHIICVYECKKQKPY